MDQETKDLITEAEKFIDRLTIKNHIVYQVRTHIDRLQRTGTGKEVLEHFIDLDQQYKGKHARLRMFARVYYYDGIILDANKIKYEYYNKANRHNQWTKVKRITHNNKPRCRDKTVSLDK